jgi:hypothetical protein
MENEPLNLLYFYRLLIKSHDRKFVRTILFRVIGCACRPDAIFNAEKFCGTFIYFSLRYSSQIAVLPQGSTRPLCVTGSPISSEETWPPYFFWISVPNRYCITAGDRPVV